MSELHLDPTRRHDLVILIDVQDGNPNGDPDADNMPRMDPETMHGLITDGAIKRKIRNFVDMVCGDQARYKIYIQNRGIALNELHERAYTELNLKSTGAKTDLETVAAARNWMMENFWDIRTFGGVMNTSVNCGLVRGPVQFTFARSIDPIRPIEVQITRVAVTRKEDLQVSVQEDGQIKGGKVTEMGKKWIVPYGLYRAYGFINPFEAQKTGFDQEDLKLLYQAIQYAWEFDRSAARGRMTCRGLFVFTHENPLGNAPAHVLQDLVQIRRKPGVEVPRNFEDYEIMVDESKIPSGVTLTRLV